jgi:hypothetical protein
MNQHSPDKEPLSLQVPRTTKVRLVRAAQRRGVPLSELIIEILAAKTASWPITSKDYEAIQKATEKAEQTKKRLATILDDPSRLES